ncbi:MAG: phosphoribosylamine--glycine ligase [Chloroflexi bacterium]|nr:phosphoribosylamine--glycine ligase [Chloroflexota bacterium]
MNVLVVGAGAREHAIAWKLRQSSRLGRLYMAPGNAGTASVAINLPLAATDVEGLMKAALSHSIDLTVVGPEQPLALGIVDRFRQEGLAIAGPTAAAARIESSKVFAKGLMEKHGIPTAKARVFSAYQEARSYVNSHGLPLVVKADGLAAGKGVFVCHTRDDAIRALERCMVQRDFGSSGDRVLVEECLVGREVSVFAFTDGKALSPLVAACDYKRLLDGDRGPNTGGMGSYSPPEFWTPELAEEVRHTIMEPTVAALAQEGCPFTGVLYAGLMLTEEGPRVLEFNCRLGDPEAQVVLPRFGSDLLEVFLALAEGRLTPTETQWKDEACVGVVVASQGYPDEYRRGLPVHGLDELAPDVILFHAGTRLDAAQGAGLDSVLTDGGRVLTVAAVGRDLSEARRKVYQNIGHIRFQGAIYRKDIAQVK